MERATSSETITSGIDWADLYEFVRTDVVPAPEDEPSNIEEVVNTHPILTPSPERGYGKSPVWAEDTSRMVGGFEPDSLLSQRELTHGDFTLKSEFSQLVKELLKDTPSWNMMKSSQKEALEFIVVKMTRILYGDPSYKDHWDDIAGYSNLIVEELSS